jgi:hypothetical protein
MTKRTAQSAPHPSRQRARRVALVALAYLIALQALLGAMAGAVHAAEMRLYGQLGVICTVHGPVDPASLEQRATDPTPGKLACIEHCMPALAVPAMDRADAPLVFRWPDPTPATWTRSDTSAPRLAPPAPPPPARGPPGLMI